MWFGKIGKMTLVSHLDLARLFDRAIRRASIPVTYSGGFHPAPRIMIANALPLGATSTGEIADFELTAAMDVADFQAKLAAQLPGDIPIYRVETVDIKEPASTQLLTKAEYILTIVGANLDRSQWETWVADVLSREEVIQEQKTKSGKKKLVNLRERLFELEMNTSADESINLRYVGSCLNDGTLLRPEQMLFMLEQISGQELQLIKIVRSRLILGDN